MHETPGVTRDRKELVCDWNGRRFLLIDTGGVDIADQLAAHALDRRPGAGRDRRGRPRPVRRRRAGGRDAGRRGAGGDPAQRRTSPCSLLANKIDDPAQDALALEFHRLGLGDPVPVSAVHGHGTGDLLDAIVDVMLSGQRPRREGGRGGDPRGDPRPAERRQVEPPERAARRGARDRLRAAGHDARRDRHRPSARRPHLRARRHRRAAPQAQASARGSSTTRSCARSRPPSGPTSRSCSSTRARAWSIRISPWPTSPARRSARRSSCSRSGTSPRRTSRTCARGSRPRLRQRPAARHRLREDRPRDRPPARPGRDSCSRSTPPGSRPRRAEPLPRRAARGARAAVAQRPAPEPALRDADAGRGRRASASSSTTPGLITRDYGYWVENQLRERFELEGVPVSRSTSCRRRQRERRSTLASQSAPGGAGGRRSRCVLAARGHDVTLACRDPEQARAIEETGRNPRYLPNADSRRARATTVDDPALGRRRPARRRRPEPRVRARSCAALPGAAPVLSLTKGLDPETGGRLSELVERRAGRRPLRPELRGGDRRRPARGRGDRERGRAARARAPGRRSTRSPSASTRTTT